MVLLAFVLYGVTLPGGPLFGTEDRTMVQLDEFDPTVVVSGGPKDKTIEFLPDGWLRVTTTGEEDEKANIIIRKEFDQPLEVEATGFEVNCSKSKSVTVYAEFADGRRMQKKLKNSGPSFSKHSLDFKELAGERKRELKFVSSIAISVPVVAGEQTVDLKNWWIE